eukprot:TRINITY_DN3662_c0_g1_i1.p1 TRINITY_DN3662_c0_g1~~TRINITY_DN3662_c0_g1_i1.p1  ORF type:complete len:477 (+),score=99.59 TRINITY_DN3662_c0_g1_i1:68-1498(+)
MMITRLGTNVLRGSSTPKAFQVRCYAKKPDTPPIPPPKPAHFQQPQQQSPQQQQTPSGSPPSASALNGNTTTSKGYPRSPNVNSTIYESTLNPRDYWKGKYYDLNTKQAQALTEYLAGQQNVINQYRSVLPTKLEELENIAYKAIADQKEPVRVVVTGAAGAIGYALLFRIASGGLFGPTVPVTLHLLELPAFVSKVKGVEMELRDAAFSVLRDIVITDSPDRAFDGVDYALLVGAQPRTAGMERGDLLLKNAEIFSTQGKALNRFAKGKDTRVLVVGNPANTNALIAQRNAPKIPPENFSAMTRLDHNRGVAQLAIKTGVPVTSIRQFAIWGNHSATQFPDVSHTFINGKPAREVINDDIWIENTFTPTVQKRGAEILSVRGASSAASAASALVDATVDVHYGTKGEWTSSAIYSNGEYGITKGLFFSYPVVIDSQHNATVVKALNISEQSQKKIDTTEKELISERDAVSKLLPS